MLAIRRADKVEHDIIFFIHKILNILILNIIIKKIKFYIKI